MAKLEITDWEKKRVGEIDLKDSVFATDVNEPLLYDVLKAQLASRRSGNASTKGRSEIRGSTRKIGRQKGGGSARHGSIRAGIFVGGGKPKGPKPRDYSYRPTRKMRQGAMRSALSLKLQENRLHVLESMEVEEVKTKKLHQLLDGLQVGTSAILVDHAGNEKLKLSARNLSKHHFLPPEGVNLYDLLRHDHVVVSRDAILELQKRYEPIARASRTNPAQEAGKP